MNRNCERDSLKIYNKLLKTGQQIYSCRKSLLNLENQFNFMIDAENKQFLSENEFKNVFESTKSKLLRKIKRCVFLGNVSSGKSTLINALIAKEILPTGFGSTSNCFVEIVASPTDENYLVINKENIEYIMNIEELKELNNIKSSNHLENRSRIKMFYNKNECQLLEDDVVIIDAPGNNSTFLKENSMEEYFKDADAVVLVVNAQSGITKDDEQFFRELITRYTKLNVIIVYNFWDIANPNDDDIPLLEQSINNAKNILCNMLQFTDDEADSSIFFISASERISILKNQNTRNSRSLWNRRNESFERFLNSFQAKMLESLLKKHYKYLTNLKLMITSVLNPCKHFISQMKEKSNDIRNELINMERMHEQIFPEVLKIFNKSFENFLMKGLDLIKNDDSSKKDESKFTDSLKNINNTSTAIYQENTFQSYLELLELIIEQNNELLKNLKENLKFDDENISPFQQYILNEIYFPFYYNLNNALKSINIGQLHDILMAINNKIFYIKCSIIAFFSNAALLAGEVIGKMIDDKQITFAAESVITSRGLPAIKAAKGGLVGLLLGIPGSWGAIEYFQMNFRFAWKNEETAIRKLWDSTQMDHNSNYSTITDMMILNIAKRIESEEEKVIEFQNKLNDIEEELQIFMTNIDLL